ncbi:hypothetical protein NHQ30_009320 [Ciborinia camelliae]|nr:hypothetical protein NHQ30_009320 [Ciborinia camelliae]
MGNVARRDPDYKYDRGKEAVEQLEKLRHRVAQEVSLNRAIKTELEGLDASDIYQMEIDELVIAMKAQTAALEHVFEQKKCQLTIMDEEYKDEVAELQNREFEMQKDTTTRLGSLIE